MKNIPTIYNDIQFRSRLEARWACFFDLMNWEWEYEPFDLDGWFPDFLITSQNRQLKTLIEVKPIDTFDFETTRKMITSSKGEYDLMLLGSKLLQDNYGLYEKALTMGWFFDKTNEDNDNLEWNTVEFTIWDKNPKFKNVSERYRIGFADCIGDFTCRVTEEHSEGGHFLSYKKLDNVKDYLEIQKEIQLRWIKAKNTNQWKKH